MFHWAKRAISVPSMDRSSIGALIVLKSIAQLEPNTSAQNQLFVDVLEPQLVELRMMNTIATKLMELMTDPDKWHSALIEWEYRAQFWVCPISCMNDETRQRMFSFFNSVAEYMLTSHGKNSSSLTDINIDDNEKGLRIFEKQM
jgi:hypothetical protein